MVGCLASFLDCFQQEHWTATIHVLRYLKGTQTLSLVLGGPCPSLLIGYTNADFANCKNTSWSVSGCCYTLGSGVVSWWSQKQHLVTDLTCYAKYMALHESLCEAIFLWQLLDCLDFPCHRSTPIHCDNDAARPTTCLAEDQVLHSEVKHIWVKLHGIYDYVTFGNIQVLWVCSEDNLADILTKPLNRTDFLHLCLYLGLCHFSTHSVWGGATTRRSMIAQPSPCVLIYSESFLLSFLVSFLDLFMIQLHTQLFLLSFGFHMITGALMSLLQGRVLMCNHHKLGHNDLSQAHVIMFTFIRLYVGTFPLSLVFLTSIEGYINSLYAICHISNCIIAH